MELPNYSGGGIVNLMSSIAQARGGKTPYKTLKTLPPGKIKDSKNIVLMVIDGLGFEYLKEKGQKTILGENLVGPITSVFLPTTACAIPTFLTGVAPQQHAFTAWHMNLKEIGVVSKILRFSPRMGGKIFSEFGFTVDEVFDEKPFFSKIKTKSFSVNPKLITNSDFMGLISTKAKKGSYGTLDSFFSQTKKAINSVGKKYVYTYWQNFDDLSHKYGVGSKKIEKHLKEFDKKLRGFVNGLRGTNTTLIITADHGFIDTPLNRIIKIEDHPQLKECLTLPLCGEGRTAYCYVRPSKVKQFEGYVKTKLKKYCDLYKGQDLINRNFFGLGKPNKKLFDRVGDYVLVCKENYIIKDSIKRTDIEKNIGHHGGVSKQEMIVPLVVIKC